MRFPVLALAAAIALTSSCTASKHHAEPRPSRSPSPSPSPSPPSPQQLLAARLTSADTQYAAQYVVSAPKVTATRIRVWRRAGAVRLDVVTKSGTATLISSSSGTVACQETTKQATCFLVARAGQPLPALFDAGLQRVFTTYLGVLARDAAAYRVAPAGRTSANAMLPAGDCFAVQALPSQKPVVSAGTYCLSSRGIVTRVVFPTGRIDLVWLSAVAPTRVFTPPATPKPLPH